MPAYPILQGVTINGQPVEAVAPGFNKQVLTDLLRGQHQYRGLILSDWAITRDCAELVPARRPRPKTAAARHRDSMGARKRRSRLDRFAKGVNAGLDQVQRHQRSRAARRGGEERGSCRSRASTIPFAGSWC